MIRAKNLIFFNNLQNIINIRNITIAMGSLQLNHLSLINYKNIEAKSFDFDQKINCFVGNNGVGKTNILDAIYHLALGKSYFNPISSQNIRHGEDFMVIEGVFDKNDKKESIICSLKRGQNKILKKNGKAYEKFSDHIGFIPLVIISPSDRDLIIEGSSTRRKFIDNVISQSNKAYLTQVINYQKVVSQRNALLKYFALNSTFDGDNLAVYNEQLCDLAAPIFEARNSFLTDFTPIFKDRYRSISSGRETVNIGYQSTLLHTDLMTQLEESLKRDRVLQYTSVGIHKDDLRFEIDEFPIKKFGSQGQQKSFLIALKLAQFDFIKNQSNVPPILLLDDVFDKLDEQRVSHIMKLVEDSEFGQIFISDTHPERTEQVIKESHQSYKIFKL